jgi:hypothetical protein
MAPPGVTYLVNGAASALHKCVPLRAASWTPRPRSQRLRTRQGNTASCGRSESDRARSVVNAPLLSALESPTCSAARCGNSNFFSLKIGGPWTQWVVAWRRASGNQHQQMGPCPLPPNECAVTAIVVASGYAVSRLNSASARSAPWCAADSCTRRRGLRRVKSWEHCMLFLIGPWVRDAKPEEPREKKLSLRYALRCVERRLGSASAAAVSFLRKTSQSALIRWSPHQRLVAAS